MQCGAVWDGYVRASTNLAVTVIGLALLVVVGGVAWFGLGSDAAPTVDPGSLVTTDEPAVMAVHVSGAVRMPGLVRLPSGSRVADAVAAAGGALPDADLQSTNLAATLSDADHIVVRSVGDGVAASTSTGIDLNQSAASDLETLPGVGPVLAGRIVAYRESNGPYRSVEDLLDVPGIGEAKLAQMRDAIAAP
jgi:competence protein ComEA